MKGKEEYSKKICQNLNFKYELGKNFNYDLFKKIFNKDFIKKNHNKASQSLTKEKNAEPNLNYVINPNIERINNEGLNDVFIFTYDYLFKNGLILEINENFFRNRIYKFQGTLKKAIKQINSNKDDLSKISKDYGVEFIEDLSILYAKIKDVNSFILGTQLYGEAKSISEIDLNNIIEESISNVSKNSSDIVGQFYEDSVLLYFLKYSNINGKSLLPRLLFYMDFIIFNSDQNYIYI